MRHDKRFETLNALDNYELVNRSQDIRGYPLVSPSGEKYGTIKDLLVGEHHDRVVGVRLEDGRTCAVEPLEIHDNAVVYGEAARTYADEGVAAGHVIEEERVPIVEEKVAIGTRVADHGKGITVRTRTTTDTVSEDVVLRDEHVDVQRRPVNERVTGKEAEAILKQGDRTVSMTERDEEVVVGKEAVVTDEVVVRKTADEKVEHVTEKVRKTEVDVDKK
jgi:stress response protein YsnF